VSPSTKTGKDTTEDRNSLIKRIDKAFCKERKSPKRASLPVLINWKSHRRNYWITIARSGYQWAIGKLGQVEVMPVSVHELGGHYHSADEAVH
jgi:hypothetical protein